MNNLGEVKLSDMILKHLLYIECREHVLPLGDAPLLTEVKELILL